MTTTKPQGESIPFLGYKECNACHLRAGATQVVPGYGNVASKLWIVGEAPGAEEDKAGIPFVGPAGKLLRNMLAAMSIDPNALFFTNVYHCRPPRNDIKKAEGSVCPKIWLPAELAKAKPAVVLALGRTAVDFFRPTETDLPMKYHAAKDTWDQENGRWIIGGYHPSYVLRQGVGEGSREGNVALVSLTTSIQRAEWHLHDMGYRVGREDA